MHIAPQQQVAPDLPDTTCVPRFEGMLSNLVRDNAKNTSLVNVEELDNHYLLLQVGPGGKRVGVQNVTKNLVQRMRQGLPRFLAADGICMAYLECEPDCVSAVATSWRRMLPTFPLSLAQRLGCDHYRLLGNSVRDALMNQKTNPTNQLKRKLDAVVGRRNDMDAPKQEGGTRNVPQRVW